MRIVRRMSPIIQKKTTTDRKSQIISFMNNSCHVLNQFGVWVYNNHLMYSLEGRKKKTRFDVGDKVICTQNNDVIIYHPSLDKDEDEDSVSRHIMFSNVEIVTEGNYVEPENLRLTPGKERLINGNFL